MKEFRVEMKVRNNVFLHRLEAAGYKTIGELCRKNNLCPSRIGDFVNLKISPLNREGEFYPILYQVAEFLNCAPEDLFSESQLHMQIESNKRFVEVSEAEMKFMIESGQSEQKLLEEIIEDEQKDKAIESVLDMLTRREQQVIQMRFGLAPYTRSYTLDEVGEVSSNDLSGKKGLSRDRIRQIEAKALRKLRHPSRADKLRELFDPNCVLTEKEKAEENKKRAQEKKRREEEEIQWRLAREKQKWGF